MFKTEAARERWIARAAVLALVVSVLATVFTFLQWRAADRAVEVADQARKDANHVAELQRQDAIAALKQEKQDAVTALDAQTKRADQANALANRSAKAAESSASVASQALQISERAYVSLTASLEKPPASGEKIEILVNAGNSGRTPAHQVVAETRVTFQPTPLTNAQARALVLALPLRSEVSVATLAYGQTLSLRSHSPEPLPEHGADLLNAGGMVLYVFADATYVDVFNHQHRTEICVLYDPDIKTFKNCHEGNKLD